MRDEKIKRAFNRLDPSGEEKQRIYNKIQEKRNTDKSSRKFSARSLLIAAIIMALTVTTVMAYSGEIQRLVFGSSVAVEVEALLEGHSYLGGIYVIRYDDDDETEHRRVTLSPRNFRVYNPSLNLDEWQSEYERFNTGHEDFSVDRMNQYTMFTIKAPVYLPNFRGELQQRPNEQCLISFFLMRLDENEDAFGAMLTYGTVAPIGSHQLQEAFTLVQRYVGVDGYFEIITTDPISRVMIGETEAVLVEHVIVGGEGAIMPRVGASEMIQRELIWMNDGVVFSMTSFEFIREFASISLEMKIAIAESIE